MNGILTQGENIGLIFYSKNIVLDTKALLLCPVGMETEHASVKNNIFFEYDWQKLFFVVKNIFFKLTTAELKSHLEYYKFKISDFNLN